MGKKYGTKRGQIFAALLVIVGTAALLLGCMSEFDARAYTQAFLDASYKNETEEYTQLTGIKKTEAKSLFEDNLSATMEDFREIGLSDELEDSYCKLFSDMLKQVKYTVGEAEKDKEGNYTVTITVEPLTILDDTYAGVTEAAEKYAEEITTLVMSGEEMPSEETMQNHVYELYYELLRTTLDEGAAYGDPVLMAVHIIRQEDKSYRVLSEDIRMLNETLISCSFQEK